MCQPPYQTRFTRNTVPCCSCGIPLRTVKVKPYPLAAAGRVCACGPRVKAPVSRAPDNRHTQYPQRNTRVRRTHAVTYHRSATERYRAPITYELLLLTRTAFYTVFFFFSANHYIPYDILLYCRTPPSDSFSPVLC